MAKAILMPLLQKNAMDAPPIKIALAEDNEYFCATIQSIVMEETGFTFMGHAPDIVSFLEIIEKTSPDIALLDLDLTTPRDGIEILKWLVGNTPEVQSIVLTVNEKEIAECYQHGARGYLLKSNLDQLCETIRMVYGGSLIIPSGISELLISQMKNKSELDALKLEFKKFSGREIEILKLIQEKVPRTKIAHRLCLSEFTVKRHVENIMKKDHESSIMRVVEKYGLLL